jgi:hypothetical protein
LFRSILKAVGGGSMALGSVHRLTFVAICPARWNSEFYGCVYPDLRDEVTMENVVDRLLFLSETRCDISAELEFLASHFYRFVCRPDAFNELPLSLLYEVIGHGSLRLESEDTLYDFISKGNEPNLEMFALLEFVRLEYCSTDVMKDFLKLLPEDFYEINVGEPSCSVHSSSGNLEVLPPFGEEEDGPTFA